MNSKQVKAIKPNKVKELLKNDLILKQLNLDTNKTLEELKYSFSFVNPAVFVNDRFYDSKLTIVFLKIIF